MQHNDKIQEAKIRKIEGRINVNELQQEILNTKMQIADLKAKEHIQKQLLKAQSMGTAKVNKAKQIREEIQAKEMSKRVFMEDSDKDVKSLLNNAISEKNKQRNYDILKNANRKRFQSIVDRSRKAQSIQDKQQKAQARR
eukprot:UN23915